MPVGVAARLELLEVRRLADVHLGGEVAANGLLEALALGKRAARQSPRAEERLACALPQERLQPAVPHLQDDGERFVVRLSVFGRLWHEVIASQS